MIVRAGLDVLVLLSLAWLYEIICLVDISRPFFPESLTATCLAISASLFSIYIYAALIHYSFLNYDF